MKNCDNPWSQENWHCPVCWNLLAERMSGRVKTSCEVKMYEQTFTSGSELAGDGTAGKMVGCRFGEELRRLIADVGAAFPEGKRQTSESMAF